jgi:hypothetical protein
LLPEKGLAIRVLGIVAPGAQWTITSVLLQRLASALAAEGIEVAYPLAEALKQPLPQPDDDATAKP